MMSQKQDDGLNNALRQLYDNQISQEEADEAAHNLLDFMAVLLEIHEQQDASHV